MVGTIFQADYFQKNWKGVTTKMAEEQGREKPYQPSPRAEPSVDKVQGSTGRFDGLDELMGDIDALVDNGSLAQDYRQTGGQ